MTTFKPLTVRWRVNSHTTPPADAFGVLDGQLRAAARGQHGDLLDQPDWHATQDPEAPTVVATATLAVVPPGTRHGWAWHDAAGEAYCIACAATRDYAADVAAAALIS